MTNHIYKTKWYLCELHSVPGEHPYYNVLTDLGSFKTSTKAEDTMYERDPSPERQGPGIPMRRKAAWQGRHVTTVKGERILKYPRRYRRGDGGRNAKEGRQ